MSVEPARAAGSKCDPLTGRPRWATQCQTAQRQDGLKAAGQRSEKFVAVKMPANRAVDVEQGFAFFHEPLKGFVIPDRRNPKVNLLRGFFTILRRTASDRGASFAAGCVAKRVCGHTERGRESYQMLARV